jgi:DNA-binding MarR family transcriptional regulator|tara:strand:- start:27712 stop:28125 length:414 start_codon:yes stop_codon:yes gene_type:complete
MELSEALFSLVHTVRINMKHEIKLLTLDLSPMHLKALKVISFIDHCTGQKLADFMGRDKAQINRLIKELVSQELITKVDNEKDKRSQFLVLSAQGTEIMTMFKKVEKKVFNSMIKDIPATQIEDFVALTQRLKNNLT